MVHADIKPDNVLVGSDCETDPESTVLYLIDYGLANPYLTESGDHKPYKKASFFVGNVAFASKNAFAKVGKSNMGLSEIITRVELSRRDDIISMIYMLLFLLNGGLPWIDHDSDKPLKE